MSDAMSRGHSAAIEPRPGPAGRREVFEFGGDLQRFIQRLDTRADEFVRNLGFEVLRNIVVGGRYAPGTPVDTGFARNSWVVSLNGPAQYRQPAERPEGVTTVPLTAETEGGTVLLGARLGDALHITSNCAYMGGPRGLEYGHSQQAPVGMVRLTIAAFGQIVHDVAQEMLS
jgi:hypothetical protein